MTSEGCACGSELPFSDCCEPVITQGNAATAEALMRSRYTAFTLMNRDYLLATWHPTTRPRELTLDQHQRWLGLRIKRVEAGQAQDATGVVEFVARYKIAGRGHRLHEVSRFERMNGRWLYVDGQLLGR